MIETTTQRILQYDEEKLLLKESAARILPHMQVDRCSTTLGSSIQEDRLRSECNRSNNERFRNTDIFSG